ncbi:MAG TPA: alpha/beta hydrolase [Thermoleophilaceae bacterium]|nr:alpha/beta hydrolase [Thermoleophilaceae bacterium]
MRHVTTPSGVEIACEVSGSGPPLVMVHGAGSARWGFALLRPLLEGRFTVIAIDRRGRGDSGDGEGPYAIESEFEDVAAIVRDAGEGALLFGHSYGALVAAGAAPLIETLPRLVLYEPPMGGLLAAAERIERWESLIESGDRDRELAVGEFLQSIGGYSAEEIEQMKATPAWELRMQAAPTLPRELRAEQALRLEQLGLGLLGRPVLMLVGSQSPEWARRSTAGFARALPRVEVRTLEGQGHGGTMSAPDLVASEIARFLERPA